ncbi:MAG: trigger factor [Elusimicrobia bacterium]|nr:trigger factor [Elusimicrobiota bacterium]
MTSMGNLWQRLTASWVPKKDSGRKVRESSRSRLVREEACAVVFAVEVPAEEVVKESERVYQSLRAQAQFAGFRQGKAPLEMVKERYAQRARELVVQNLISKNVQGILQERKIVPTSVPAVRSYQFDWEKPLTFEFQVEQAPRFQVREYHDLKVTVPQPVVREDSVQERIRELQHRLARLEVSAGQELGKEHFALVDYEVSVAGKPVPDGRGRNELVEMSAPQTISGLVEAILGCRRGQEKTVSITYRDQPAQLQVKLVEIKEKRLPALDEEFAKDLGASSLAELESQVRQAVEQEEKTRCERELQRQVEERLLETNPIEVPRSMVEAHLEEMLRRAKLLFFRQAPNGEAEFLKRREELRGRFLPDAERDIKLYYILSEIARQERIAVAEEDLQREREADLARAEASQKASLEQYYQTHRASILTEIQHRKVMQYLKELAGKFTQGGTGNVTTL